MTCVVAVVHDGRVLMGADSAGSGDYTIRSRKDPKIYEVGAFMFGFTSSFRMGQLLGHAFVAPDRDPRVSTEKFMATTFVDAVRYCLKSGGYSSVSNGVEHGGVFLVGYEGRVFRIDSDFQVGESLVQYEAVGCGAEHAVAAMYATQRFADEGLVGAEDRITLALKAAEEFSLGVRGPFLIRRQGK